jgi:hypothetical protein
MLPPQTCKHLVELGHDAISALEPGILGLGDAELMDLAVGQERVLVTENFPDFAAILEGRLGRAQPFASLIFVRKSRLPQGGGLAFALATRLDARASEHPQPPAGLHWA